jgi:hypothetical protein
VGELVLDNFRFPAVEGVPVPYALKRVGRVSQPAPAAPIPPAAP